MIFSSAIEAWRAGWKSLARMVWRDLDKPDLAFYYKVWWSWRLPAFWATVALFWLPLGLLGKTLLDADRYGAGLLAFIANLVVALPLGGYFASKWWLERKRTHPSPE